MFLTNIFQEGYYAKAGRDKMNEQERIKHLRKTLLRITQGEFAEKINMSRSNFANIEKGNINLTERVIADICREFSVRREWLTDGEKPVFFVDKKKETSKIVDLYESLNEDNQKYAQGYINRLLEEQNAVAAFTGEEELTVEEIKLLRQMLNNRKEEKLE
jgi:transcriptional regulator with XRE-family HTH domain